MNKKQEIASWNKISVKNPKLQVGHIFMDTLHSMIYQFKHFQLKNQQITSLTILACQSRRILQLRNNMACLLSKEIFKNLNSCNGLLIEELYGHQPSEIWLTSGIQSTIIKLQIGYSLIMELYMFFKTFILQYLSNLLTRLTKLQAKMKKLILVVFLIAACCSNIRRIHPTFPRSQIKEEVAGIIISFHHGNSYDNLFTQVKQESKEGSVVFTYASNANFDTQKYLLQALMGDFSNSDSVTREIVGEIQTLTLECPSCIVFNWQCSSGFSNERFANNGDSTFGLLQLIIKRGYIAMFSDFSLKALIKEWRPNLLGPNPFVKIGQTSTPILLKFDKNRLLRSPSSQLQAVARISSSDQLSVRVLGGTIIYAVDKRVKVDSYGIQVLTIAENFRATETYYQSQIKSQDKIYRGSAGHVILSYQQGGKILTSMGHWIQLMNIKSSKQTIIEAAETLYGRAESAKVSSQLLLIQDQQQMERYLQKKSKIYIQNQSPGVNKILKNTQKQEKTEEL